MSHFILIINKAKTTWIPPRFGVYEIAVEQMCLPEVNGTMIHFCCGNCDRITSISDNVIPAIYTLLPGDKWRQFNYLEFVKIKVNGPVHFYFTDETNEILRDGTPILRLIVRY